MCIRDRGIGFAVPVDTLRRVVPVLVSEGRYPHATLGLLGYSISAALAEALGLPVERGVLVAQLARGGPADAAGVRGAQQEVIVGNRRVLAGGDIITHLDGREIHPRSPQQAQALGISTVYQEVNLCPNLSVAENILLGREPRTMGRIDWKTMYARARQILARLDMDIDVRQSVGMYSVAVQQMVAISRALEISARVLILDEPTSCLLYTSPSPRD